MIDKFFTWIPNKRGWWMLVIVTFLGYMQGKVIPRYICEIFDYYDYDVVLLNIMWLIFTALFVYKLVEHALKVNYEQRKNDI